MDNNKCITNTDYQIPMQLLSCMGDNESCIYEQLFRILRLNNNDSTPIEYMDCTTVTGIFRSHILFEEQKICSIAEVSFSQIAYEDIQQANETINERIDFYTSVSRDCESLRNAYFQQPEEGCPIDTSLKVECTDTVRITTPSKENALIWHKNISCVEDLLNALICKFNYLAYQCKYILNIRVKLSESPRMCAMIYNHHMLMQKEYIYMAAKKVIEDVGSKTSTQKQKYIKKVDDRYIHNPLSEHFLDTEHFAKYIANAEGVSSATVFDFLLDYYILNQIDKGGVEYPWLKKEWFKQLDSVLSALKDCYDALRRYGHPSTKAYAILFIWMRDHIKIADDKKKYAISKYTLTMNQYTNNSHAVGSIFNSIIKLKQEDISREFMVLDVFADTYGIKKK